MEGVYKHIPRRCLPIEYLPDDYKGEHQGPAKELSGNSLPPCFLLR